MFCIKFDFSFVPSLNLNDIQFEFYLHDVLNFILRNSLKIFHSIETSRITYLRDTRSFQ